MRFSGMIAPLLFCGSCAFVAQAEPKRNPSKPSRAEASKAPPNCTAPTMQGSEQGESVGNVCVANTQCVRTCGQRLGEAIAAAHEPQDEVCKGNPDCERNESTLRIKMANTQTGLFVGCLWLCWAPKTRGQCRSDYDCTPSRSCSTVECDQGSCSELEMYNGTRCADSDGVVGACEKGECVSPNHYLSTCGPTVSVAAANSWKMYTEYAERCRDDVNCDRSIRSTLHGFRRNIAQALMECVSTALELGADPKGK